MKLILYTTIILLVSCDQPSPDFNYLLGTWHRSNGKPETTTIESWNKVNASTYASTAIVLEASDTIYIENSWIRQEGTEYYYVSDAPENKMPIKFKIIEYSASSFKAVNNNHDFPKVIRYSRSDSKLKATISGNGNHIDYHFEKQ